MQTAHNFQTQIAKSYGLKYLLYLPPGYDESAGEKWPLLLFLHGRGERGDDLEIIKAHGIPRVVEEQPDFPFIAVSPQCPDGTSWMVLVDALDALLTEIVEKYAVDRDRVYLTGLSMGGTGTWCLASAHPERFAAIAPVCGWGDWYFGFPERACSLKSVPAWAFHGDQDEVVSIEESYVLVETLRACGGDVRLTVYPGVGHDSWTATYDNPELYRWLLAHKLG